MSAAKRKTACFNRWCCISALGQNCNNPWSNRCDGHIRYNRQINACPAPHCFFRSGIHGDLPFLPAGTLQGFCGDPAKFAFHCALDVVFALRSARATTTKPNGWVYVWGDGIVAASLRRPASRKAKNGMSKIPEVQTNADSSDTTEALNQSCAGHKPKGALKPINAVSLSSPGRAEALTPALDPSCRHANTRVRRNNSHSMETPCR